MFPGARACRSEQRPNAPHRDHAHPLEISPRRSTRIRVVVDIDGLPYVAPRSTTFDLLRPRHDGSAPASTRAPYAESVPQRRAPRVAQEGGGVIAQVIRPRRRSSPRSAGSAWTSGRRAASLPPRVGDSRRGVGLGLLASLNGRECGGPSSGSDTPRPVHELPTRDSRERSPRHVLLEARGCRGEHQSTEHMLRRRRRRRNLAHASAPAA